MKLRTLIYGFTILFINLSCKEPVIESQLSIDKTIQLKSATIGTNYYVSKTGNDSYPGTLALPFRTIQKAANLAAPGDSVIVRNGTYTVTSDDMVKFWGSGTPDNYITYKSENKWGAVLDGLGISSHCFMLEAGISYLNISGFEIKNFLWEAFILNNPLNPNSNIRISDNRIHDIGRECTDTDSGHNGAFVRGASSIIFERNIFHNIGRYGPNENGCSPSLPYYQNHDHGIYIDGCTGVVATYNIFYNMQRGWGVHIFSSSGKTSSNVSIQNNTFAFGNPFKDGGHIVLDGKLTNSVIKNNIFYGQVMAGIAVDTKPTFSNVIINNNMTYGGEGLIVSNAPSGIVLSNNINNTDPKMVNPAIYDFRLQSTSPAVNAGVNVGLTSDYLGNAIIGLPDIGAYESSVSSGAALGLNTTVGLNTVGGIAEKGDNGYWMVSSFTAGSNITVNRMNLYVSTASGNARLGIYTNSSGEPGVLLAQTGEISLSNGWNSGLLGSSQNLISGVTYWLAIEVNSSLTTLYYNSAIARLRYNPYSYGTLPSTAPTGLTSGAGIYSVYADNNSNGSVSVSGISVSPTSASISVKSTQQLIASVSPSSATNKNINWSSDNTSVATVSSTGLVTGVAAGRATITVTTLDGSKSATSVINISTLVGSTIGLNTIGSISEKGDFGHWVANSFTAVSNIKVSKMNLFVSNASGNARMAIYSSSSSEPGTLLAQTGEIPLSNGWNSGNFGSSLNLTTGVTYWLAFQVNSSATTLYYNPTVGRLRYKSYTYSSFPSLSPTGLTLGTGIYSIYAD